MTSNVTAFLSTSSPFSRSYTCFNVLGKLNDCELTFIISADVDNFTRFINNFYATVSNHNNISVHSIIKINFFDAMQFL